MIPPASSARRSLDSTGIFVQRIARRADGADQLGLSVRVDRLAQPPDMHIDGAQFDVAVLAPHAVEQALVLESAAGECSVFADARRIKQVILNLATNASKYSPERSPITIRVETAGERLQDEVADAGIGISQEDQEKIFSPFVQADSSVTRRFGGTASQTTSGAPAGSMSSSTWFQPAYPGGLEVALLPPPTLSTRLRSSAALGGRSGAGAAYDCSARE